MSQLNSRFVFKLRESLTIVCHQTRSPDNLGAVARLMANFGLQRLVLSSPVTSAFHEAEKMAVRAHGILQSMVVVPSLDDALREVVYACGTTSRTDLKGREVLTPEAAVERLAAHAARGPVALVLGGEQRGLSDEELWRCQEVLAIPTEAVQPSMNLAQSAAVLLYLCARADRAPPSAVARPPGVEGARLGTVGALETRMRNLLLRSEFLNPQDPNSVLHELMHTLTRGSLSQRDAELWLTAFKHLERAVEKRLGGSPPL
ncbi:MAG TPA: RNA methyltransferase [Myxococcaceae bacterium]|nr:RNA methyltransferase [Myxococcaceae bacterium]